MKCLPRYSFSQENNPDPTSTAFSPIQAIKKANYCDKYLCTTIFFLFDTVTDPLHINNSTATGNAGVEALYSPR